MGLEGRYSKIWCGRLAVDAEIVVVYHRNVHLQDTMLVLVRALKTSGTLTGYLSAGKAGKSLPYAFFRMRN
jgi:hypothetical protein